MGKRLVFMPECHSTNAFALDLCQQPLQPEEGTVIATANQFAGRGQRGNTWTVEPGKNLTFSIIIYPHFLTIPQQFYLNMVTSLGICDYLVRKACTGVHIKWPNDVYASGRKICGILIESQLRGKVIQSSVIGVGLNINQREFAMPTATSLSVETNQHYVLSDEIGDVLVSIEQRYLKLRDGDAEMIKSDYLAALYRIHERHSFVSHERVFNGIIQGVDDLGKLVVLVDDHFEYFDVKEIRFNQ